RDFFRCLVLLAEHRAFRLAALAERPRCLAMQTLDFSRCSQSCIRRPGGAKELSNGNETRRRKQARITGRAGTFAVKGVMARKYPDGMRPNEGERTKIRRTHREFKAQ